jgi:hypothetical protein
MLLAIRQSLSMRPLSRFKGSSVLTESSHAPPDQGVRAGLRVLPAPARTWEIV